MKIILDLPIVNRDSPVAVSCPQLPDPALLTTLLQEGPVLIMPGRQWRAVLMQAQVYETELGHEQEVGTTATIIVTTDRD